MPLHKFLLTHVFPYKGKMKDSVPYIGKIQVRENMYFETSDEIYKLP